MNQTLHIVYTTSTGHTEFVIDTLITCLQEASSNLHIVKQRAETTEPEDLKKNDMLLLACGSWNTGNIEGQVQPHMYTLLEKAKEINLQGLPAAAIGLGDDRYYFTARAAEKLTDFLASHHATLLLPALKIINEPFDQKKKIEAWASELATVIAKLPSRVLS